MSIPFKSILLQALTLFVFADVAFAGTVIPKDADVLDQIAPASRQMLPNTFDLLVWNVHKGADKNAWAQDLYNASSGKEVVLLQEAMKDDFMPSVLRNIQSLGWVFATSWINTPEMFETGISTGSVAQYSDISFRRSPGREPFTNTPKMTLITSYPLFDGGVLKVVNLHGINFVSTKTFQSQLNDVASTLQGYRGPLVFAGDFNTWNNGRMTAALTMAKNLGLTQVQFPDDKRGTQFDHIFIKGCSYSQSKILVDVKTSDHSPLAVTLNCRTR